MIVKITRVKNTKLISNVDISSLAEKSYCALLLWSSGECTDFERGRRKTMHQPRRDLSQMRTTKYVPFTREKAAFWNKSLSQYGGGGGTPPPLNPPVLLFRAGHHCWSGGGLLIRNIVAGEGERGKCPGFWRRSSVVRRSVVSRRRTIVMFAICRLRLCRTDGHRPPPREWFPQTENGWMEVELEWPREKSERKALSAVAKMTAASNKWTVTLLLELYATRQFTVTSGDFHRDCTEGTRWQGTATVMIMTKSFRPPRNGSVKQRSICITIAAAVLLPCMAIYKFHYWPHHHTTPAIRWNDFHRERERGGTGWQCDTGKDRKWTGRTNAGLNERVPVICSSSGQTRSPEFTRDALAARTSENSVCTFRGQFDRFCSRRRTRSPPTIVTAAML